MWECCTDEQLRGNWRKKRERKKSYIHKITTANCKEKYEYNETMLSHWVRAAFDGKVSGMEHRYEMETQPNNWEWKTTSTIHLTTPPRSFALFHGIFFQFITGHVCVCFSISVSLVQWKWLSLSIASTFRSSVGARDYSQLPLTLTFHRLYMRMRKMQFFILFVRSSSFFHCLMPFFLSFRSRVVSIAWFFFVFFACCFCLPLDSVPFHICEWVWVRWYLFFFLLNAYSSASYFLCLMVVAATPAQASGFFAYSIFSFGLTLAIRVCIYNFRSVQHYNISVSLMWNWSLYYKSFCTWLKYS